MFVVFSSWCYNAVEINKQKQEMLSFSLLSVYLMSLNRTLKYQISQDLVPDNNQIIIQIK